MGAVLPPAVAGSETAAPCRLRHNAGMTTPESPALRALIDDRSAQLTAACRAAGVAVQDDAGVADRIRRTLLASDFAFEVWRSQPQLLGPAGLERLRSPADAASRGEALRLPEDESQTLALLRRFRRAEALRLVFRDVNGLDDLPATLSDTSVLYEVLLEQALAWSERQLAARYGHTRGADGSAQRMVVVGFGKLGGSEMNL